MMHGIYNPLYFLFTHLKKKKEKKNHIFSCKKIPSWSVIAQTQNVDVDPLAVAGALPGDSRLDISGCLPARKRIASCLFSSNATLRCLSASTLYALACSSDLASAFVRLFAALASARLQVPLSLCVSDEEAVSSGPSASRRFDEAPQKQRNTSFVWGGVSVVLFCHIVMTSPW